ncbi:MAG: hypothetical protein N3B12_00190 [Armatimonadetes bacterium]|nr:hypothetical protein [Armatimonadota bacterium]
MSKLVKVLAILVACIIAAGTCEGLDNIWDLEAVDQYGIGTHPKVNASTNDPNNRVIVEGIALAGSSEILNPGPPAGMGIAYTLFIQDDTSYRGGIQAWAGSWFYGDPLWTSLRNTDYINVNAGDRVRITGFLADAGRGKVVINHRHSNNPVLVFTVEVLGHPGLPDPVFIPSVSACNYFDQTRAGGGEFYQTRYAMLHGLNIVSGNWANNSLLTVADSTGSVGMLLSLMGDFNGKQPPQGKLNVVGIFDQEDTTLPHTEGYRLWVKRQSDVALALDACRQVRSRSNGERVGLANKVVSRAYPGYFYIQDAGRTGGVRVVSNRSVVPGNVVCVQGSVTSITNEKVVTPTYLIVNSGSAPKPIGVTSRELWRMTGLDVRGLLVRCVCKIGVDQGGGVYSLTDDAGKTIYVQTNGVTLPSTGTRVAIDAVVSELNGTPMLLLASGDDVHTLE